LRCLVTGGSGYIGGRLVPELLAVHDLIATTPAPRLVLDLPGIRQFLIGHDGIVLADGRSAPDIDPPEPGKSPSHSPRPLA
jgi:nucleoside-diphosphate-sugar epimerase